MKKIHILAIIIFLGACIATPAPEPTPTTTKPYVIRPEENPYSPKPDDANLRVAGVKLTSTGLLERFDLDPFRVEVDFLGSLPSVCNEIRIKINPPNINFEVFIEVYSLVNPKISCDDVFQTFETSILLGVYSTGRYTVWVNEGLVGDFVTY